MAPSNPLDELVIGYPKLAGSLALYPESAIFRRFGALNARNLLYFQAELVGLEKELQECETSDNRSSEGMKSMYAVDWYWLANSERDGDGKQLNIFKRIRETLKEYNEALALQSYIINLPDPSQSDLGYLRRYLETKEMGPLALLGPDALVWGSTNSRGLPDPDLLTLGPRNATDPCSRWVIKTAVGFLSWSGIGRWLKPSKRYGVVGFKDSTALSLTYVIMTILAALIPWAAIMVLYCVHSMTARLLIIGAFNLLLSGCLVVFTTAKRSDIFAITAAFAAVLVVFVSANNPASGNGKQA